jgi:signal transduction histidine kinase
VSTPTAFAASRDELPLEDGIALNPRNATSAAVLRFAAGGLVALVVLAVGAIVVLRDNARDEAMRDAIETTDLLASALFEPSITDGILTSEPDAVSALDQVSAGDGSDLARVKLWASDGTIVYSDEHRLIGQQFDLDAGQQVILRAGGSEAEVSDLTEPENRFEPRDEPLVEVYQRVSAPNGTALLFEAYYRDRDVAKSAALISWRFIPVVLGALVVFALIQIPLGLALARKLRAGQRERETLLRQAIDAQSAERRRIAGDLHDGVVQDLAGVSYTIVAAKDALGGNTHEDHDEPEHLDEIARALDGAARATRRGIQQLRTLLVDLYPPNLRETGLPAALRDLLAPLANAGVHTTFVCPDDLTLADDHEALLYRGAHEALRNTLRHADARTVDLRVDRHNGSVRLVVRDDGRGFDPGDEGPAFHFGLRALADLAAASNATLTVDSTPSRGTTVRLDLGNGA